MPNSTYPLQVDIPDEKAQELAEIFKNAYKEIVNEIATATDFGVARRKAILAQIERILTQAGVDVDDFLAKEMPEFYSSGARDAVLQLKNVDAPVPVGTGFDVVHKQAIRALIDDTSLAFQEALAGVNRSANLLLNKATRDLLTQKIATGIITGDALREVRQTIKGVLAEQGLDALTDKSGRTWSLDRYAEMLFRTRAVQARNHGFANRMVENGYDLVQVSQHFNACPLCQPWEGKILSLTGKTEGWPTLAAAESGGLFHPNCRHAINGLIPSLATKTKAYDPNTQTYGPEGIDVERVATEQMQGLVDKSKEYDSVFKSSVNAIASQLGYKVQNGPVKTVERVAQKILRDYNGSVNSIKDINRSLIFIDDPKDLDKLVAQVKQTFEVDRVKNGFGDEGYQKAIINVRLPIGTVAEIQVTTPEMYEARKYLGGHELYKQIRLNPENFAELEAKMMKLYADAAEKMAARLK